MSLAFDLFMVEDDLIKENELNKIINGGTTKRKNLMSNLLVVADNTHLNENLEIKIKKDKGNIDFSENEISENKSLKLEDSFFSNQNRNVIKVNLGIEKSENETINLEKVRKDMVKGYLELLN